MPGQPKRVYLDVCALCRPFDDQTQLRIRLESDAVLLILNHVRAAHIALVVPPVHQIEIAAIQAAEEREHLFVLLSQIGTSASFDRSAVRSRAEAFSRLGLGPADAAHVAFAEEAEADFITCDDRLLKQCRRVQPRVWAGSPLLYCDKENLH